MLLRTRDEDGQQRWPWQVPRDKSPSAVLHSRDVSARAPSDGGVGGTWLFLVNPWRSRVWLSTGFLRAAGALVGLGFEREVQ